MKTLNRTETLWDYFVLSSGEQCRLQGKKFLDCLENNHLHAFLLCINHCDKNVLQHSL